ncbi:MAG: hypothetical protein JJT94_07570 [Bernardetiaceae bacterium]|nr:hypothetical protein [Bernardetiaceae bacterium]
MLVLFSCEYKRIIKQKLALPTQQTSNFVQKRLCNARLDIHHKLYRDTECALHFVKHIKKKTLNLTVYTPILNYEVAYTLKIFSTTNHFLQQIARQISRLPLYLCYQTWLIG